MFVYGEGWKLELAKGFIVKNKQLPQECGVIQKYQFVFMCILYGYEYESGIGKLHTNHTNW